MSLKIKVMGVLVILGLSWWFVRWIEGISLQQRSVLSCPDPRGRCWALQWAAQALYWGDTW